MTDLTNDRDAGSDWSPGRIATLVVGELIGIAAVLYLLIVKQAGWPAVLLLLAVVAAFTVMIMRAGERGARAKGAFSPAMARYNRRMLWASMIYIAGLMGAITVYERFEPTGVLAFLLAFVPSIGVLSMIAAMARLLVEEKDEYLRHRYVRSAGYGLATLLTLATVWGFFEQFELVPHAPGWLAVPVFAFGMGLAQCRPGANS